MKKRFSAIIAVMLSVLPILSDNIVTIGSGEGAPGEEVTISIVLQNTDVVSSMQLQMQLPDNVTLVDGSAQLGSRATDHQATVGVKDGALNVFVYSMNMSALTGSDGEVVSFRLLLGNQPVTQSLTGTRLVLTDTDGNSISGSIVNGSVTALTPKAQYNTMSVDFGHIPIRDTYNRQVTVTNSGNAPLTVTGVEFTMGEERTQEGSEVFSSTTTFPFTLAAGASKAIDITYLPVERGAVMGEMKVVCNSISKLNYIRIDADPFAVNELHIENVTGISDSTVTIPLRVNNMDELSGFQIEFNLPSQLRYVEGSAMLASDRKEDHALLATHKDGHLTLIAYSITDKKFKGNDGVIATFQVELKGRNSTSLNASKAVLTATYKGKDMDVLSAKYAGYITIKSPRINVVSSIDFGETPVTQDAVYNLNIWNSGNAPLNISRVVFDKEGFTIDEQLPITIEGGRNTYINVRYGSLDEVPFNAIMQLYSNDPDQRVWNVSMVGSRFAPNYISSSAADIYYYEDLMVKVALDNYDAINGLQFDLEYPSDYYEPTNELTTTARAQGLSVQTRSIGSNIVRCFFYSLSDAEIAPGDGEVLTLKFAPKGDVPIGAYTLKITNVKLGTSTLADKYAGGDLTFVFNVKILRGDVTRDGKVDISDVTALIDIILGKDSTEPYQYDHYAADVTEDNKIDISDVTALIDIILGKV